MAILSIDNIEVDDHILRASFGTTKYCTFFLKNLDCPNKDCLYLHYLADDNDIIQRVSKLKLLALYIIVNYNFLKSEFIFCVFIINFI